MTGKLPSGAALEIFDQLDSTNLEARRRIAAGARGPAWLIARSQTAGYGRRAREWVQARGDFAGTLFLTPDCQADRLGQISFITALAVINALQHLSPRHQLKLKWPNDILVNNEKLAGILLELVAGENGPALIIGIGVNIVSKPQGVAMPAARLQDLTDKPPAPQALASGIDTYFWPLIESWKSCGFAPIRREWLAHATRLGDKISVRLPNEELFGVFQDIDENGALILRIGGETRIINAGDVYFGAAQS